MEEYCEGNIWERTRRKILKTNWCQCDSVVFLLNDIAELNQIAKEIIKNNEVLILNEVVAEIVYVLEKSLQSRKERHCNTLIKLFNHPNIFVQDLEVLTEALKVYVDKSIDFCWCYISCPKTNAKVIQSIHLIKDSKNFCIHNKIHSYGNKKFCSLYFGDLNALYPSWPLSNLVICSLPFGDWCGRRG